MAPTLDRADFQGLVQIFADHRDFRTEASRWGLIDEAFRGVPRASAASGGLDLRDPPRNAAVALVGGLADFGCLGDRHSLALVLETLRDRCGDDLRPELDRLSDVLDARCRHTGPSRSGQATADILHLSDLHFGTLADAHNFHSQVAEDLKGELGCLRLDGLICSGDLTQHSTEAEYAAAVKFLTLLAAEFGLGPERMVLIPGNHDLSWDLAKAAYDPGDPAAYAAADDAERRRWIVHGTDHRVRVEDLYRQRFDPFSTQCHEKVKGTPYPSDYPDQFAFDHWADLRVLVLGLNSAWEIDHHHRDRAGIHPEAVTNALNTLRARPDWADCLKIAVWHHPLEGPEDSRITDHGFLERLAQAGFRLALHGHIHKAQTGQYHSDLSPGGRRIAIVAAGTFGAPSRDWTPGYPLQYNLLRLAGQPLTVETRRREEPNGARKPDARWLQGPGKDPLPRYWVDL
jgi:hypothetical protein